MTYFQIAVAVLLAVLVAAAVPALLQLRKTLASAQEFLDTTGPQVERTLGEITTAAEQIQRVASEAEQGVVEAKAILHETREIVAKVGRIRDAFRVAAAVGGAVGPAVLAAAKAFFTRAQPAEEDTDSSPATTGEPAAEEATGTYGRER